MVKPKAKKEKNKVPDTIAKIPWAESLTPSGLYHLAWNLVGVIIGLGLGYHHVWYSYIQHENEMWFTNIEEVEREISFRTESGLYYSYFKQTVQAKTIGDAFHQFVHDNKTEFPNEVNILERFNIYQEIVLGIIYRIFQPKLRPIIWYTYSVFNLQLLYSFSLYATSWMLTGTWFPAVLTSLYFTALGVDMTRISFTVPLRESFALPFWALQNALLTRFFMMDNQNYKLYTTLISVTSFLFAVCWQFNQFVFLLQACALYGAGALDLVPITKIKHTYISLLMALLFVYFSQFFNEMTIRALVVSFIPAAWLTLTYRLKKPKDGAVLSFVKLAIEILLTLCIAGIFQYTVKLFVRDQPDEHIFKFLKAKFGIAETDDFDAKLYLCNGAFGFLSFDTFQKLISTGMCFLWIIVLIVGIGAIFWNSVQIWSIDAEGKPGFGVLQSFPELGYNIIHSFVFFTLALSTMRMKYLWSPHAAVLASCVALPGPWKKLGLTSVRYSVILIGVILLHSTTYHQYQTNISKESEFYDPDTVELMKWAAKLPRDTVFSGSMQLNAGVRLSSWRALTNHPHYEDKRLRKTTFDVYQMYAHRTPEEVLERLGKYGTTHILVENSICYMGGRKGDNCATPDLLDLANGHFQDGSSQIKPGLPPRFCDEVRRNHPAYQKYFKLVLENNTFRVYKLVNNAKWDVIDRSKLIKYFY